MNILKPNIEIKKW